VCTAATAHKHGSGSQGEQHEHAGRADSGVVPVEAVGGCASSNWQCAGFGEHLGGRYVSGYLETDPPPGSERLAGADASHAWISFYCHGLGWIDMDPTNNLIPGVRHISVARGRDYNDVSPVRGVILGAGTHKLHVAVDVAAEVPKPSEKTA